MASFLRKLFSRLDRLSIAAVGENDNPFTRLGSLAVVCCITAIATGVLLLPFYDVSIHRAYQSVSGMLGQGWWYSGIIHSVHRYSSDAAVFFSILHFLRVLAFKSYDNPRILSWITGVFSLNFIWIVGWLGFWLVWDQTAFVVAESSARLLDALPIFGTPLTRGLLLDKSVNNQIFFTVFFIHMLVPLALFVTLWIHVSRVNRPVFLTTRKYAAILVGALVFLAVLIPAPLDSAAKPLMLPEKIQGDVFYLSFLYILKNLHPGWAWVALTGLFVFLCGIPFFFRRPKIQTSFVTESNCVSCNACFHDCPYQAIEMRPRTDGLPYKSVAWVDPSKCVGCGICNGSCDTLGNNLPWIPTESVREKILKWAPLAKEKAMGLAFVCRENMSVEEGQSPELPDCFVISVPCVGHVNPGSVKLALDSGFSGVLIAASGPGSCKYREGQNWIRERVAGKRKPRGRLNDEDRKKIKILQLAFGDTRSLKSQAHEFFSQAVRRGG